MPSITIKLSNGTTQSVSVADLAVSVAEIKAAAADDIGIPANEQRLVFKGKILKDDQVASAAGLCDGCAVHVVRSAKPAAQSVAQALSGAFAEPLRSLSRGHPRATQERSELSAQTSGRTII